MNLVFLEKQYSLFNANWSVYKIVLGLLLLLALLFWFFSIPDSDYSQYSSTAIDVAWNENSLQTP